ncbi:MAG: hypothetical protein NWE89_16065 [Candidatus Bathyarchaeota archaeon]|nr:hypothetical protein [Candidatus Bathyarchaeota archaeon]
MDLNWKLIERLFKQYLVYNPGRIGGGLYYGSIPKWMADRKQAYSRFSPPFNQDNLKIMKNVCHAYGLWLSASNNKSWTNLPRRGRMALDQPEKLCKLFSFIQQETVPIEERIQKGLAGEYKVDGIGKGILSGLLHTMYPEKYGVWNGSTVKAFKKLDIIIPLMYSTNQGRTYARINAVLNNMALHLDTNLTFVDGFMWYVATRLPETIR